MALTCLDRNEPKFPFLYRPKIFPQTAILLFLKTFLNVEDNSIYLLLL